MRVCSLNQQQPAFSARLQIGKTFPGVPYVPEAVRDVFKGCVGSEDTGNLINTLNDVQQHVKPIGDDRHLVLVQPVTYHNSLAVLYSKGDGEIPAVVDVPVVENLFKWDLTTRMKVAIDGMQQAGLDKKA